MPDDLDVLKTTNYSIPWSVIHVTEFMQYAILNHLHTSRWNVQIIKEYPDTYKKDKYALISNLRIHVCYSIRFLINPANITTENGASQVFDRTIL